MFLVRYFEVLITIYLFNYELNYNFKCLNIKMFMRWIHFRKIRLNVTTCKFNILYMIYIYIRR